MSFLKVEPSPAFKAIAFGLFGSEKLWTKHQSLGISSFLAFSSRMAFIVVFLPVPVGPVINILNPSALVFKPVSIALIALSCPTMFIKGCTSLVDVKANFLQLHVFFKSSGFNSSI